MYDIQSYQKAHCLQDALKLLEKNPSSRLIAGGTDVLIKLRHHNKHFSDLIDLHDLAELRFIQISKEGVIRIGSASTFTDIIQSSIIQKYIPALAQAVSLIAGPQIRNVATIGGNICNGAPSADAAPQSIALEAEVEIQSIARTRYVPLEQFYLAPGKVDLANTEIATAFLFKKEHYQNVGGFYYKYAIREAMDIATIGCAVACAIYQNTFSSFKLAYGVAAPTPIRARFAEKAALGKPVTEATLKAIQKAVLKDVSPRDSWRASKAFRLQIIQVLAKRVALEAIKNAGGKMA